jgi:hypothetical protein
MSGAFFCSLSGGGSGRSLLHQFKRIVVAVAAHVLAHVCLELSYYAQIAASLRGAGRPLQRIGLARFGRNVVMLSSLPPEQHASLPASVAVTAVTSYPRVPHHFWTGRVIEVQSPNP